MKAGRMYANFASWAIAASMLGMLLMFLGPARSYADDRGACQQRIERAEGRLREETREHGPNSPQAHGAQHELNEAREGCWNQHHAWWNGSDRQWHSERDWDRDWDRDHDRYREGYRGNAMYQSGYQEGLRIGSYDRRANRAYQPANYKAYKNNGNGDYRQGFVAGYDEGYGRRR